MTNNTPYAVTTYRDLLTLLATCTDEQLNQNIVLTNGEDYFKPNALMTAPEDHSVCNHGQPFLWIQ